MDEFDNTLFVKYKLSSPTELEKQMTTKLKNIIEVTMITASNPCR